MPACGRVQTENRALDSGAQPFYVQRMRLRLASHCLRLYIRRARARRYRFEREPAAVGRDDADGNEVSTLPDRR